MLVLLQFSTAKLTPEYPARRVPASAAALQRLALPKLLDWQLHRLLVRLGVERLGVNFKSTCEHKIRPAAEE